RGSTSPTVDHSLQPPPPQEGRHPQPAARRGDLGPDPFIRESRAVVEGALRPAARRRLSIGFLHPSLGLGGAERVVVDAATELKERGHHVVLCVAEHEAARAFPETVDGRLEVAVHGGALPGAISGRFRGILSIARAAWAGAAVARQGFDVIVCDQVAYPIPLLRRIAGGARILYYCHHPDRLLAPSPRRGFYRLYRAPLD